MARNLVTVLLAFHIGAPIISPAEGRLIGNRDHLPYANTSIDAMIPTQNTQTPPTLSPRPGEESSTPNTFPLASPTEYVPGDWVFANPVGIVPVSTITSPPTSIGQPLATQSGIQTDCTLWATCNLFFQYVGVHYWSQDDQKTDCLSETPVSVTSASSTVELPQSPNGVVVFSSIEARNGCQKIGRTFSDYTYTFGPNELSTVRDNDPATYSLNFADFPCPPASVSWTSPLPYTPRIAPPLFLTGLDPAWSTCIPGASQGIDPFTALTTATRGSGLEEGKLPGRPPFRGKHRGAPEDAVTGGMPSVPPKTAV